VFYSLDNARSLLGIALIIAVCWAVSENRARFPWRLALGALALQAGLVALVFALPNAQVLLDGATAAMNGLTQATQAGTQFVFGYLGGGRQPYPVEDQGALFIFAFQVLPLILVVSSLSALLWHWRILKWITQGFGLLFQRTMGLSGPSALAAASNIILGYVEAPIVIRAYLNGLSRSELFLMMTVGLATVAGSTMAAYALILRDVLPNAAGHILVASIISAPAGVLLARIMIPEEKGAGAGEAAALNAEPLAYHSAMDAVISGVRNGLEIVFNVAAVLLVFVALTALANQLLGLFPPVFGAPLSLERVLGVLFAPLAWIIGVDWNDAIQGGYLLGVKMFLTEFVAFLQLGAMPEEAISDRSRMILAYALCGFANVGSVGVMVAGVTALAPARQQEIMQLAAKSLAPGFLATCLTASVVAAMPMGMFTP
jgi:CNT family concentrative nucleoside transporter